MRRTGVCILPLAIALATSPQVALAEDRSPLLRDSYAFGSSVAILCQAQDRILSKSDIHDYGVFRDEAGQSIAGALGQSQLNLMNDPITSHPFSLAAFTLIGDYGRSFLPSSAQLPADSAVPALIIETALKS